MGDKRGRERYKYRYSRDGDRAERDRRMDREINDRMSRW
jgi:hypothetical protein